MNTTINVKQGLGDIRFGMPVEEIVALLGNADEVETIDNALDDPTTVLHYDEADLTLFLEGENPKLSCIDTSDETCTLFGQSVFALDERALVALMVEHGYVEQDVDNEDWGERRVSFGQANIDFFYDGGQLVSVSLGA